MLLTGTQLKNTVPTLKQDRADYIADKLNFIAPAYKMNDYDILHEFIANVAHESGGFRIKEENMNYSAKRLRQVWPPRFPNDNIARKYAHNPKALANLVYGNRMGNRAGTNDGYDFRGGGFIQLTGRSMYEAYKKFLAFDDVYKVSEVVRHDDYYALDSACWVFAVQKKLIQAAINDKFIAIVKAINGGVIGLKDRQYYYERAKRYIT